jgi:cytochrome c-type biogenesis protein CcsB
VYATVKIGYIPVHNLHGTVLFSGWSIASVFLLLKYKLNLKILGIYAAPLATLTAIIAFILPNTPIQTSSIFKSVWLDMHIVTIFIGEASLAMACGAGLLYLVQEHAIKNKIRGFFFKRLPSLERIDNTGYACIIVGFSLLTLGLITGMVYAKSLWGSFWSWDPKEIWSGVSWLIYAALLHGRISIGWRGRKAALMSIGGFTILLFTFIGVNFLLSGHHGQFTTY